MAKGLASRRMAPPATRSRFRFLIEHDLRANAFRVCREGKPASTFPGHAAAGFPSLLRADRLSRRGRLDAQRRPRPYGGFGLRRSEIHPTAGRELIAVPDHAGRDAVDIGNIGAAKTKRVIAARCLLLGGIGMACRGQHRNREHRCEHQTELEIPGPDSKHDSSPRNR